MKKTRILFHVSKQMINVWGVSQVLKTLNVDEEINKTNYEVQGQTIFI